MENLINEIINNLSDDLLKSKYRHSEIKKLYSRCEEAVKDPSTAKKLVDQAFQYVKTWVASLPDLGGMVSSWKSKINGALIKVQQLLYKRPRTGFFLCLISTGVLVQIRAYIDKVKGYVDGIKNQIKQDLDVKKQAIDYATGQIKGAVQDQSQQYIDFVNSSVDQFVSWIGISAVAGAELTGLNKLVSMLSSLGDAKVFLQKVNQLLITIGETSMGMIYKDPTKMKTIQCGNKSRKYTIPDKTDPEYNDKMKKINDLIAYCKQQQATPQQPAKPAQTQQNQQQPATKPAQLTQPPGQPAQAQQAPAR